MHTLKKIYLWSFNSPLNKPDESDRIKKKDKVGNMVVSSLFMSFYKLTGLVSIDPQSGVFKSCKVIYLN